jgi:mannose-1-phosphate guanylyltransferase
MAKSFLDSGDFVWNAGIFIWNLKSIQKAFNKYLPEVSQIFSKGINVYDTDKEEDFINEAYSVCKNISIDYGIMEKADNVYVLPENFGWSDLGTWGSLFENSSKDKNNNAIQAKNVLVYDSTNNIINVSDDKLIVIQGLNDYIVVESENSILICKKEEEQLIRNIVNDVKLEKGNDFI